MSDSVGSVSVEVVPDARGWSEKLRAQLRDQSVEVKANADTEEANVELDKVARTRTAKIKADTSQLSEGANALDKFVGNLGLLPSLAITAGAALVPLAATLGGIALSLAAPLVIAGGGATLFAFLAGFAVKDTEKQLKTIDSLQKKLSGLTKGTAAYKQAQKDLKAAQDALSPGQRRFLDEQSKLHAAFQNFLNGPGGKSLMAPLTDGMKILADLLPKLSPVIAPISHAISGLLGDLAKAADSPGFDRFLRTFGRQAGTDIAGFGHIAGNLASGLGGLFQVLDRSVGHSLVDQLVRLTGAFSDWANSKQGRQAVHDFLDYFHRVGPQVADSVGAVARATGHLVHALAPLGPPVLRVIQGIADAISAVPVPVLTAMAGAFAGLVAFQKVGGLKTIAQLATPIGGKSSGGLIGGLASKAGVVPVYVTNKGFGDDTGIPGLPGGPSGEPKTKIGKALSGAEKISPFQALLLGAFAYEGYKGVQRGVGNVQSAGSSMFGNQGSVGGSGPRTVTHTTVPFYPSVNYAGVNPTALHTVAQGASAYDSLRSAVARASRAEDMLGPHAVTAAGIANHAIDTVQAHLNSLRDKRFQIIAQDQQAVSSLERLQAWRLANKTFTVTALYQQRERAVGPGGGIGHHASGGLITGAGTGTSDSIPSWLSNGEYVVNSHAAAANRALLDQINYGGNRSYSPATASSGFGNGPVRLVVPGGEFDAYIEHRADGVYRANRAYESAARGM